MKYIPLANVPKDRPHSKGTAAGHDPGEGNAAQAGAEYGHSGVPQNAAADDQGAEQGKAHPADAGD